MSEQQQESFAMELGFRVRGSYVIAELSIEGRRPIMIGAIRLSLIATPDASHLWHEVVDVLVRQLMDRKGMVETERTGEAADEHKADD